MSARRYYDTTVLSFAQLEQAVLSSTGEVLKSPKQCLRRQDGLRPGRETNLSVTQRAIRNEQDLVRHFRSFVLSQLNRSAA
jgi:hypothetical protein